MAGFGLGPGPLGGGSASCGMSLHPLQLAQQQAMGLALAHPSYHARGGGGGIMQPQPATPPPIEECLVGAEGAYQPYCTQVGCTTGAGWCRGDVP